MSQEISSEPTSSGETTDMTDLEKKIQAAGQESGPDLQGTSNESGSNSEMTDLEKKIQAAGEELGSEGATASESGDSADEDLTDLEKKIQSAGEDSEDK